MEKAFRPAKGRWKRVSHEQSIHQAIAVLKRIDTAFIVAGPIATAEGNPATGPLESI